MFGRNAEDIAEISEISGQLGLGEIVFTNGRCLTPARAQEFASVNHDISYVVNINSLDEQTYEATTGVPGSFQEVRANLSSLRGFFRAQQESVSYGVSVRLAINTVLSALNKNEVIALKGFAGDLGAAYICTVPMEAGRAVVKEAILIPSDDRPQLEQLSEANSSTGGPTCKTIEGRCGYIPGYSLEGPHGKSDNEPGGIAIDITGVPRACAYLLYGFPNLNLLNALELDVATAKEALIMLQRKMEEIIAGVFHKFGFHYCFMRHPRFPEIENWLIEKAKKG